MIDVASEFDSRDALSSLKKAKEHSYERLTVIELDYQMTCVAWLVSQRSRFDHVVFWVLRQVCIDLEHTVKISIDEGTVSPMERQRNIHDRGLTDTSLGPLDSSVRHEMAFVQCREMFWCF